MRQQERTLSILYTVNIQKEVFLVILTSMKNEWMFFSEVQSVKPNHQAIKFL